MSDYLFNTNYFGVGINGASSLFGSSGGNPIGGLFANTSLYKGFSEVNSIGYKKLVKAYYEEEDSNDTKTSSKKENLEKMLNAKETEKKNTAAAKELKADAAAVKSGADELTAVDEEGNTTLFDKERKEIDSAIKNFVSQYNELVNTVSTSSYQNNRMSDLNTQLQALSKANKYVLDRTGITVNSNGSLTIRENDYAAADVNQLKSAFGGANSFASRAAQKAEYVTENAMRYTNDTYGTYNSKSIYKNSWDSGNLFNNFF